MLYPTQPPAAPFWDLRARVIALWEAFCRRWPITGLVLVVILSNLWGTIFNFAYNKCLVVDHCMDQRQQDAFWNVVSPLYNLLAWSICLSVLGYLIWPLQRGLRQLRAGIAVSMSDMERCRLCLVNLPVWVMIFNGIGWFPGTVAFPSMVCWFGGDNDATEIWWSFLISFTVSTVLTTIQTFFLVEAYVGPFLYPEIFRDARPAEVPGSLHLSYLWRLRLLWCSVVVGPLLALLAVAYPLQSLRPEDLVVQFRLAVAVFLVGGFNSLVIFYIVGRGLLSWIHQHAAATEQIAQGNFAARVAEKRPDEWGQLTDRFNDMAVALERGEQVRETFGQIVHPEIRDEIMERYAAMQGDTPSLGGEVRDLTVMFADIRGFTRRSSGEDPERIFRLLHSFLTQGVAAVEEKGRGQVNKFLGDGFMALFGIGRVHRPDHADLAVAAALELVRRLHELNEELARQGQAPLVIGIGLHSGPALVGCIGATLNFSGGRRFEFGAIGDTINVGQRIEQLTKTCGGPILLSEQTHVRMKRPVPLAALGPQRLHGCESKLGVYRVLVEECGEQE